MYPTTYHRPRSLKEAREIFGRCENASLLSGGHTLIPALKLHLAMPSDLIDLCAIDELRGIEEDGYSISIGATTCHAEVAASPLARARIPALAGCAGSIGDRHVRHRGTIGGSVANNDPAADYPSAVLALGGTIITDRRKIVADDFFVGLYETALEPGEIVTRILFPVPVIASYAKFRNFASRYAIVGVFIARTMSGVRVAVTGAGAAGVFRATALETALTRDFRPQALSDCSVDPGTLMSDQNGTAEYRAHLITVMARRAMENPGAVLAFK